MQTPMFNESKWEMLEFDEASHRYHIGEKELISVTRLMRKHGLAPDYSNVPTETLNRKAEFGRVVHKEIEEYLKEGKIGFTDELGEFIKWKDDNGIEYMQSEVQLHNDIAAGTADLIYGDTIADIKTTSAIHTDAVSWQLSIYNLLNGWKADKGMCIRFKDGKLKAVEIKLKDQAEVEKLMECERKGEIYKQPKKPFQIDQTQLEVAKEAMRIIEEATEMKAKAEARMEEVKAAIKKAMDDSGYKTYDDGNIRITITQPTTRSTIDVARLRKERPEIADEYEKEIVAKPQIRIKFKGEQK